MYQSESVVQRYRFVNVFCGFQKQQRRAGVHVMFDVARLAVELETTRLTLQDTEKRFQTLSFAVPDGHHLALDEPDAGSISAKSISQTFCRRLITYTKADKSRISSRLDR